MADVDELLTRLAKGLVEGVDRGEPLPLRMCRTAAGILSCDGGAITIAYTEPERVTLCATDDVALLVEETQDLLEQGPGPDAYAVGECMRLELGADIADPRWPLLETSALTSLAPAVVHAVPLGIGGDVIGVLTLYQQPPGPELDVESALALGRVLRAALMADAPTQHDVGNGPWSERAEVHQATGMVVAQLRVAPGDALALIRAHAYSHDQSVGRSAHDVITLRLTFSSTPDQEIEST